ncbi:MULTISPECIES: hypothetical protein [Sanguibacteroides]|uniref:Macroglobulin domain-containing protein n=1 Tax=Sanguibacteroides justesenii TaxID=1547597 RepID=A0AB34R001_9PORP|nr:MULTISPECIES: hypothetical protein [Sanguibacteroides]KIO42493.1 hypothetical protein IE90_14510 [Sanguibacteroides justesenii]PXZ42969.1 hypothetical protein DMB45_12565 [Sanguibacteroides justesenii]
MKRIALLTCLVSVLYAFREIPPFKQELAEKFYNLFQKTPKEKIYLHTDKEIYYAGEDIWFRAHQVDAATHIPHVISRILYVELTDKQDSVLQRLKFMEWDSAFSGNIRLPEKMVQGNYCIRAFTYWMQNEGTDYFFKKNIRILNPSEARVNTDIRYIRATDNTLRAEITFTNARNTPYVRESFQYQVNKRNATGKTQNRRTDDKGILRIELEPDDYSIHLSTKDKSSVDLDRYLYIPMESTDFDVQFFPEGGNLITNNYQVVAFKAIDTNGLATEVEGHIYTDSTIIAKIKSEHEGMGSFKLPVYNNRRYYAELTNSKGITKRFELPSPVDHGFGIQLTARDSIIEYKIMQGEKASFPPGMTLLLQCRGRLINLVPADEHHFEGKILRNTLPEGIIHAVLVDTAYRIYSQRIFFIRPGHLAKLDIATDKEEFVSRESVTVKLLLDSIADRGSFSMAVVPDSDRDTSHYIDDIQSNLLLTSDLKGYIEEPGYYFSDTTETIARHTDLLMLTHGWTRFNIADIAKAKTEECEFYLERGQSIAGKVKDVWGKAARKARLLFLSDKGDITMTEADSSGRFCNNLFFIDGTKFVVRATNQKGKHRVEIEFDKEKFLPVSNFFPYNEKIRREEDDFYNNAYENYYYENGEKIYLLNEVKVVRKIPPKKYTTYDNWVDDLYRLDSAQIANEPEEDIVKLIVLKFPGLMRYNDEVYPLGPYPPKRKIPMTVNGFLERNSTFVRMIPKRFLLGISLLTGPVARNITDPFDTSSCKDTVLLITTRPDYHFEKPSTHFNINRISPQGIQIPDEFYVPKYEIDSVRLSTTKDERTTLYWQPLIRLEPGKSVKFSFYTGDKRGSYTIIIEGVTRTGAIIRKMKKIKVN